MDGLIMDYQLNVPAILRRGEQLFGDREIVTRLPDKSWHRYTYAEFAPRARRLAAALRNELGLKDGDRVGTFAWNHYQHLETYIGVPVGGMVTHTLNLRLHPDDLTYIATHAGDRVLIADKVLWPLVENFRERAGFEHVIAIGDGPTPDGAIEYEDLLASAEPGDLPDREIDERAAAAMCYTSGTTGQPKGALYSHRAIAVHSLASAVAGVLAVTEDDTVLPVVPMFHANAWGFPFTCTFVGAKQVFPGPFLDGESLLEAFQQEQVTITAGVPTIWMGILQELDANPGKYDTSSVRRMVVGGSAAPQAMIEAFEKRHGLSILHAWGMTEMCPLGTVSELTSRERELSEEEQFRYRAKQGVPAPFVEIRSRGPEGLVPWDGETMGELEVRGVWISSDYYESPEGADRWTDDGWFKTGDIVTIEPHGYIEIQDRSKDLVKSGGEWISTVALENALMGHPAVAEAAVIAVPDEKWSERPLAVCVFREGTTATDDELRDYPRAELREVVAAGALRDRRGDPEDRSREVPQDRATGAVLEAARAGGDRLVAEFISTEQDGYVAVVTIDHPPVNALSAPLLEELEAEIDRLDHDAGVRAIVLLGAGERAFVAGADISEFPSLREAAAESQESGSARGIQKLGARMDAAHKPFVAAIHGFCLGGGLELAMCCDIRVASEDAQLGQPEIKLGLIPGGGGTQRLPRLVGLGRAHLLNMTGEFIDARTAYDWGLVERVVAKDGSARDRARHREDDRGPLARRDRRARASSPARPATSRSRKGFGERRTASAAASRARTERRASQRSWRSASRSSADGDLSLRFAAL